MDGKKQLNILLASSYPFIEEPGGVKDFILGLKTTLLKNGCKVSVVAPGSKDAYKKGLVDFVLGMGIKVATDQTVFRASLSRKETAKKILEKIKPDIIVIHEPFIPSIGHTLISSVLRMKNSKRPIIIGQFHARREGLNWQFRAVEFVARHLIRRPKLNGKTVGLSMGYVSTISHNLDGRIAVSKASEKFWQKKSPARHRLMPKASAGGPAEYKVIYNGIDTRELCPSGPASSRPAGLRRTKVILFAGRHDSRKGISDLINALHILRLNGVDNIRLKITGKGEITESLRELVKKLKLEKFIQFVGILPRNQLVKAYQTADLLVAPSRDGEGFNRTIIEARSCGTLVVCTDIEGHREAIGRDLSPFMAQPKNPQSLAKQIMAVLNLPETEKQKIRKKSREDVVASFDWDKIVKQHLEYYQSLIVKR